MSEESSKTWIVRTLTRAEFAEEWDDLCEAFLAEGFSDTAAAERANATLSPHSVIVEEG